MRSRHIFVLTGAGVSAESGLSTFRDKDGLWSQFRIEDVASIEGYRRDPARVLDFYNMRRERHADVQPNAAHLALASLERGLIADGRKLTLCTQNIDNLHERAGSTDVIHMHGEISKARCMDCGAVRPWEGPIFLASRCPLCGNIGGVRPHVVWFGEMPLEMDRIFDELTDSDLFVSIGSSGAVYPAAGFVAAARNAGIGTVELNLEPSENAEMFLEKRYGPATEIVPAWVREVLAA
jgi:NAD-dependent deacetylase